MADSLRRSLRLGKGENEDSSVCYIKSVEVLATTSSELADIANKLGHKGIEDPEIVMGRKGFGRQASYL